jgi:hypothetical protein
MDSCLTVVVAVVVAVVAIQYRRPSSESRAHRLFEQVAVEC